ncbi:hypothetical protein C8R45DRAFT_933055 [Mycena sanguinolenta]|nr:hypothetical protein C8R45DRAFT_933055 [Mycena sanguinolenta]
MKLFTFASIIAFVAFQVGVTANPIPNPMPVPEVETLCVRRSLTAGLFVLEKGCDWWAKMGAKDSLRSRNVGWIDFRNSVQVFEWKLGLGRKCEKRSISRRDCKPQDSFKAHKGKVEGQHICHGPRNAHREGSKPLKTNATNASSLLAHTDRPMK